MTLTANEFLDRASGGDQLLRPADVFPLLILYRWFSLVPPLIAWLLGDAGEGSNHLAA